MEYGNLEVLKNHLLFKRIVKWNETGLHLEDGTIVTIEESESDCCASAGGVFKGVVLDAMITNVEIGEVVSDGNGWDMTTNEVKVTLFHNLNPVAVAEMYANDGNGGYYYSVASFVVNGIHYKIVEA